MMSPLAKFTNPRMHLFHIPQCSIQNRNVHISVLNGALWDMEQVHSGICEIGLLCSSFAAGFNTTWLGEKSTRSRYSGFSVGKCCLGWATLSEAACNIVTIKSKRVICSQDVVCSSMLFSNLTTSCCALEVFLRRNFPMYVSITVSKMT